MTKQSTHRGSVIGTDFFRRALSYCYLLADIIQNPNVDKTLKFRHLTKAFSYMIRTSQRRQSGEDFTALQKSNELSTKSLLLTKSLQLFIDNSGILRARGRLSKAPFLLTSKNPIILDAEDWTINLVIKHIHIANRHSGLEYSRAALQEHYWILRSRKVLRSIISKCIPCRRLHQDIRQPLMGDLPRDRLQKTSLTRS